MESFTEDEVLIIEIALANYITVAGDESKPLIKSIVEKINFMCHMLAEQRGKEN